MRGEQYELLKLLGRRVAFQGDLAVSITLDSDQVT